MPVKKLTPGKADVIREGPFTPLTVLLCLSGVLFWLLLLLKLSGRIAWAWPLVCIPIYAEVTVVIGWLLAQLIRIKRKGAEPDIAWQLKEPSILDRRARHWRHDKADPDLTLSPLSLPLGLAIQ